MIAYAKGYTGNHYFLKGIIQRHCRRTFGVSVRGANANYGLTQLRRIVGISTTTEIREGLDPKLVSFLQGIFGAIFQQDNAHPHAARNAHKFFTAEITQLFSWPAYLAYLLQLSPIENVSDFIGRLLTRYLLSTASIGYASEKHRMLFHKHSFKFYLTPSHVVLHLLQRMMVKPNTNF